MHLSLTSFYLSEIYNDSESGIKSHICAEDGASNHEHFILPIDDFTEMMRCKKIQDYIMIEFSH
jgi:hypothetical protein